MTFICTHDKPSHLHTNMQACVSISHLRSWKKSIDVHSTSSPTHTYDTHTTNPHTYSMHTTHTHTHSLLHSPMGRGKHQSLTSSCIMCLKCSSETAKQAVTVTALKWGGITQLSFHRAVRAICNTILDSCFSIDVIMRKKKRFQPEGGLQLVPAIRGHLSSLSAEA